MAAPATATVRRYFDAWNQRDLEALGAVLGADAEWERSVEFPEGRTLRGRERIVDFARSMFEVFAETPIEIDECVECGEGAVVVSGTTRFRGDRSGAETSSAWVRVYDVADGEIVAVRQYENRRAALEAIGSRRSA
jgi:ketosteroid isomerase-like protein